MFTGHGSIWPFCLLKSCRNYKRTTIATGKEKTNSEQAQDYWKVYSRNVFKAEKIIDINILYPVEITLMWLKHAYDTPYTFDQALYISTNLLKQTLNLFNIKNFNNEWEYIKIKFLH